jgi:hypothetical protein
MADNAWRDGEYQLAAEQALATAFESFAADRKYDLSHQVERADAWAGFVEWARSYLVGESAP